MAEVNVKCLLYGAGSTEGGRSRMSIRIRLFILILQLRIHCAAVLMYMHDPSLQIASFLAHVSCKIFSFCCTSLDDFPDVPEIKAQLQTLMLFVQQKQTDVSDFTPI